jgi:exopolysaccharide biosynthesis polyprenyl glycosylphosphotransferase
MTTSANGLGLECERGRHFALGKDDNAIERRSPVTRRVLFYETLVAYDGLTVSAAFAAAYFITAKSPGVSVKLMGLTAYLWLLWVIVPTWLITLRWFNLYDPVSYSREAKTLGQLVRAHTVAMLLLLSTMYVTKAEAVSRLLMQTFLVVSFAMLASQKKAIKVLLEQRRCRVSFHRPKVLLIGQPRSAQRYFDLLISDVSMNAEVIGLLAPCSATKDNQSVNFVPILGSPAELLEVLKYNLVDEVIALPPIEEYDLQLIASACATRGLIMRMLIEVPRARSRWYVNDCGDGSLVLSLATVPQDALRLLFKRVLDIAGALVGLPLSAIIWMFYGTRLKRETGASILFRQPRVGQNGRLFTLYKFRTMYEDAEHRLEQLLALNEMKGPIFKLKQDPRVTPTGGMLRRRHLDELPQFWNVLKGEMSLVGTRPPTYEEVARYRDMDRRRLSIKPGLTGLWQLNGNDSVNNFEEVVNLDCQYIENWSLALDLRIIFHTIKKVFRADAY